MKRFTILIGRLVLSGTLLLSTLWAGKVSACISEAPTYNNYLFSVFHRSMMEPRFITETDAYWKNYLHTDDGNFSYQWNRDAVMAAARGRGDQEMVSYLRRLNSFLDATLSYNAWDYPSKAKIAQSQATMRRLLAEARSYKGNRLKAQYMLMTMRTQFALKQYRTCANYWQQSARRLPQSVYRDMMENLYAGCLLRTGQRRQAVDIYARQEDFRSLRFCVKNYRNLDGIRSVYAEDPNSPTLLFLVQDFVNNLQETQDVFDRSQPSFLALNTDSARLDWLKEIGAKPVYERDAQQFIAFARTVVAEGKTRVPCLWQAAIGCMEHQMGRYAEAKVDLEKALTLSGTPRMKDNARAIYAVNSAYTEPLEPKYTDWLTGELQWMDAKRAGDVADVVMTDDHYGEVKQRLVYHALIPRYTREGQPLVAVALMGMMDNDSYVGSGMEAWHNEAAAEGLPQWNPHYATMLYVAIDTMSVAEAESVARFMATEPTGRLERYVWGRCYRDADYYNDLIGTKLMAEGCFDEAIPYLEKVSLGFLDSQNIAPYAAYRRYSVDRWFKKQAIGDEAFGKATHLKTNAKLDFCRQILTVQSLYQNMRPGEERRAKAYELASLLYQAGSLGDCWWLTQYGVGIGQDSTRAGYLDFTGRAIELLGESAQSTDFELQQRSLYALAFIPRGLWYRDGWDEAQQTWYDYSNPVPVPSARQYVALQALAAFARNHTSEMAPYVSKCDVLKRFGVVAAR